MLIELKAYDELSEVFRVIQTNRFAENVKSNNKFHSLLFNSHNSYKIACRTELSLEVFLEIFFHRFSF